MDSVQAVSEEEIPNSISTTSEKVTSLSRAQALVKIMFLIGWLMVLADGAGMAMVLFSYHEKLGVFMVVLGLFGGIFLIGGAFFLQSKIASKTAILSDQ